MFLKRSMLAAALPLLLIGMLLAACGTTTTATTPPAATTAPTAAPAAVVMVASATVTGKSLTILTDAKGMTLYYFTPDSVTTATCTTTGDCLTHWPALLFTGTGTPTSATALTGTLSVVTSADGAQVQYQGHFLYTFAGDKAAGDTAGQGLGGKWFVATTDLSAITAATSASVSTATATVAGKSVTILTDAKGMTLYYFTPDTATTATCTTTGDCLTHWPAVLFTGTGTPSSAMSLPGALTVVTSADGAQVQYQGHFLYTFAGDKAAGDTTGQGLGGKWFVATTDLAAM